MDTEVINQAVPSARNEYAFCPSITISLVTLLFGRSCHEFLPGRRQRALPKQLGGRKSGDE